ncbi:MAG TPA: PPC domain-containing DNA-binding protein [Anaerolineales bacterium]
MKNKLLSMEKGPRTFAIVFDQGDEMIAGLMEFSKQQQLTGSHFTAIGAFSEVTLGYFQRDKMEYKEIPVKEQVEVLSLVGNIAMKGDEYKVHAHVVLGRANGSTLGGHIQNATVWPTLEIVLIEEPAYLRRAIDETTGLALIDLETSQKGHEDA